MKRGDRWETDGERALCWTELRNAKKGMSYEKGEANGRKKRGKDGRSKEKKGKRKMGLRTHLPIDSVNGFVGM